VIPESKDTFRVYKAGSEGTAFVFLHGAGHTALSWALAVSEIRKSHTICQLIAYDCRAHGSTQTENEEDLSAETLTKDCINLINILFKDTSTKIVLVGHSMGGAIAARAAASQKIPNLVGLIVVDVVEGTALAALAHMHGILECRPKSFSSIEEAIDWSVSSGMLKKIDSAKVSIPPQLVENDSKYTWRTDLFKSEQFWKGWFENLSNIFLSAKASKMLLLAGTDRLDKDLTIAQMQGKYQLTLFPAVGHTVQEDDPQRTANALVSFLQRNRW